MGDKFTTSVRGEGESSTDCTGRGTICGLHGFDILLVSLIAHIRCLDGCSWQYQRYR